MFHLLAFAGNGLDATAGDVQVNAVTDQMFRIVSNRFVMPSNHKCQFAYVGGANLTRARIVTPKYRVPALPQIVPINAALAVPTNPGVLDLREMPLNFQTNDELEVQATNSLAATVVSFLGVTKGDLVQSVPNGDCRWVRFTSSPTGVALGWSARAEVTFQDSLDSGVYGVYGLHVTGTTAIATRLIFNNAPYRPGCIGAASADIVTHKLFRGDLGLWGTFENSTPPGIEHFNSAAGAVTLSGLMLIKYLGQV